ncbi:hypothetical protein CYMTET_19123 [Cymbomonas tetramitiformis]|uniref:AAA+ ATPase domain-containing protein n=1 Tax=Cymbomonas tetramitiformis TaxID=36881 RepID=A0AAE0G786_9CHLO|nr:hypothetical protein CYMTET_19123 [Cymbomonas tetramitiformis]
MYRWSSTIMAAATAGSAAIAVGSPIALAEKGPPPQFDPEALERGAKALREINSSTHAKSVFELTKKQEETKLQESKTKEAESLHAARHMEVEKEKIHWEEMRKTQQQQAQTKAQLARYEDELARKRGEAEGEATRQRNAEMVAMQEESSKRTEIERRLVEEQVQAERVRGEQQRAEIERETLRQKALFEADGRIKESRENEDVHRRQMLLRLAEERDTALESINATFKNLGAGLNDLVTDQNKLMTVIGGASLLALGVYSSREGTRVAARLLERWIGQPTLVRETSRRSFSSLLPTMARGSATSATTALSSKGLGEVVLEPKLDERVRQLAAGTANWKRHNSPFRNALFYGPPGTGKTLAARRLAQFSGLDYAVMTGGDVAPLGGAAVTQLHELFDWAQTSNKGMLLFIDEADAFLGTRSKEGGGKSEGVRAALNALLSRTGDQSKNISLILATNRPSDLDAAVCDRMDELLEFPSPGVQERQRIFTSHLVRYLHEPKQPTGFMSRFSTPADPDAAAILSASGLTDEHLKKVAEKTQGFSGRELAKLAASVQGAVFGEFEVALTPEILADVVDTKVKEHATRTALMTKKY